MLASLSSNQKSTGICVILAMLITAAILAFQLVIEPITGVADNGDFHRATHPLGLYSTSDLYEDRYFNYLERYWQNGPRESRGFLSSQQILIVIGIVFNKLIIKDTLFDIVTMGVIHSILLLPAIALLAYALFSSLGKVKAWIIFALGTLVFLDSGYITYFNTFYSEAIAIISLFYMAAAAIAIIRLNLQRNEKILLIGVFYLFAFLFITSKNQFAIIAPLLAWTGYRLSSVNVNTRSSRLSIALSLLLLIAMSLYFRFGVPNQYAQFNRFNSVFSGILLSSPDPETDLNEMGIDPKFATLAGFDYWEVNENLILSEEFEQAFFEKVTFIEITEQYWRHPHYLIDQLSRAIRKGVFLASDELGHYEKTASFPALTHSQKFNLWSNLRSTPVFGSLLLSILFYMINLLSIYIKRFRLDRGRSNIVQSEIHFCIVLASILVLFAALIGDGQNEIIKHLLLFNFFRDFCLIILAAELLWILQNTHITFPHRPLHANKTRL